MGVKQKYKNHIWVKLADDADEYPHVAFGLEYKRARCKIIKLMRDDRYSYNEIAVFLKITPERLKQIRDSKLFGLANCANNDFHITNMSYISNYSQIVSKAA